MSTNVVPFNSDAVTKSNPRKASQWDSADRLKFLLALMEDPELSAAAIRAAGVLVGMYNHEKGCAWPSTDTVAKRIGVTRQTVSAAFGLLSDRGWFEIKSSRDGNRQGANRYYPQKAAEDRQRLIERRRSDVISVGETGHSNGDVSVGFDEPQCQVSSSLSVGFLQSPVSGKPDSNHIDSEPSRLNPEERTRRDSAHPRDRSQDTPSGRKVTLPDDWNFEPSDRKNAIERGLTSSQIDTSLAKFREMNKLPRSIAEWSKAGRDWLANERVHADGDEMVTIGDGLSSMSIIQRRFVKPGQSFRDSRGVMQKDPRPAGNGIGGIATPV